MTFRLRPLGGLGNRLQAILSYRAVHGKLDVFWAPSDEVSYASWDRVFAPLDDVRFVEDSSVDVEDWAVCQGAPVGWERAYGELIPAMRVLDKLYAPQCVADYLAVHIRRTDYVHNKGAHGGHIVPLVAYHNWALQWPSLSVYLATDNGETQRGLRALIGHDRVLFQQLDGAEEQGEFDRKRQGTLADAVVDIWRCRGAKAFMGSPGSSFTATIERLRALVKEGG
jgi:hypothetical protein